MTLLQRLLFNAARKIAANPEARAKAAEIYRDEVKPRAEQAVQIPAGTIAGCSLTLD